MDALLAPDCGLALDAAVFTELSCGFLAWTLGAAACSGLITNLSGSVKFEPADSLLLPLC